MPNYTKTVNFAAKDALAPGTLAKRILGSEIDTELNNISTAVASKLDASALNTSLPLGSLIMYPSVTAPSGWLVCNGQEVSRSSYSALFSLLGTTFGSGDGSSTFNLPNYNNRLPVGAGGLYAAGAQGGSKDSVLVQHTHVATVNDFGHSHNLTLDVWRGANAQNLGPAWGGGDRRDATNVTRSTEGSVTTGITVSNSTEGVSGSDANMPPYLGIYFIIKATT